ncbi:DUF4998 domain-containing protein [Pedobacter metabolipauper]|uniref:F5/8 type C domain-containing protein n=1 Tax=Pedobacter metabolipauper TaxID=425513 RepID=A0A4V3D131_9SPHI|nr:DUF4998 domain-containing protein [Pedobacter metabolipauper]TDQ08784.1 F5/8 type C domain-containing protein [Pedobacter metabolipauper]
MKSKLYYLLIVFAGLCVFMACKKMDSTYEQYVIKGGIQYPGAAKSAVLHGGNKRAILEWLKGSDPKIVKARIFWNNYADSVEVPITASQSVVRHTFTTLAENFYSFTIKTYDAQGHVSVPVEVSGSVYGDNYQSRVLERPLNAAMLTKANVLKLNWSIADSVTGAFATDLEYTNTAGVLKTVRFKGGLLNTEIADYKLETNFRYRTLYLPDSLAIDTFYTGYLSGPKLKLDKKEWVIANFDNNHPGDENKVANIIDGNPGTRWHGLATNPTPYPHYFSVNMGAVRTITDLSLWRMNTDDRAPESIKIETSLDNVTWTDQGTFAFNRLIDGEQIFTMKTLTTARYFKVTGLRGPQAYIVLGEVDVYVK